MFLDRKLAARIAGISKVRIGCTDHKRAFQNLLELMHLPDATVTVRTAK